MSAVHRADASAEAMARRVRDEYLEMPGLRLSAAQAQRLCGIDHDLCVEVLRMLVDAKFLQQRTDGTYVRLTEGTAAPPFRMAKIDARTRNRRARRAPR